MSIEKRARRVTKLGNNFLVCHGAGFYEVTFLIVNPLRASGVRESWTIQFCFSIQYHASTLSTSYPLMVVSVYVHPFAIFLPDHAIFHHKINVSQRMFVFAGVGS